MKAAIPGPKACRFLACALLVLAVAALPAAAQPVPVPFAKSFINDPVIPGSTVTLEFTLVNFDRDFPLTGLTFTDDLDAVLSGLVASGLPATNVCGPGSTLSGTSVLTLTGGSLAADGGTCTFSVTLQVPPSATVGFYPNTTSQLTGSINGGPYTAPAATDNLEIGNGPSLNKIFIPDAAGAGSIVTVEFTLLNNSFFSPATAITFTDNLDAFLPGTTAALLPAPGFCGAGSTMVTTVISSQLHLQMTGGSLPPGGPCTFSVDLQIPAGAISGSYLNVAGPASATIDGGTQVGGTGSATLDIVAAPTLRKTFSAPVLPGETVTLEFELDYPESATASATAIAFTDDLTATLAGLVAVGLPQNDICGVGSSISGTSNLSFSGGTLAPGDSCIFSVTLQVPAAAAPGFYPNTTSSVTATVAGTPTVGSAATDTLQIAGLDVDKSFTDDPALPGGTVTLEFTLRNGSTVDAATAIGFTDNLGNALTGLAAVGLPMADVCGMGSSISGTGTLTFAGGSLAPGATCTFSVTLQVPPAAVDGSYLNVTSSLTATINAAPVVLPPATDTLTVTSELLLFTKSFTDDPVVPGGTVTLQFTLDNLDPARPITAITFTDDLDAALSGLLATGLPLNDVCGAGSQISGSGLLTLTGGSLPAGGSCTFSVSVLVPAAVPFGPAPINVTSSASGLIAGLPVSGPPATDTLLIQLLDFSKSFSAPVQAGDSLLLTFTLQNLSTTSAITDLSFVDDLNAALPGLVAVGLPQNDVCGAGSLIAGTSLINFTGGSLGPGASCSIPVTVQVPAMTAPAVYTNTTGTLNQAGSPAAPPAVADLLVTQEPIFTKVFLSAPVLPGGQVLLEYTIENPSAGTTLVAMTFTDDFGAVIPGLAAVGLPAADVCGAGSSLSGTGVLTLTGGNLPASGSCTFTVTLQLPAGAPLGTFPSTTSPLSYVPSSFRGIALEAPPATADLTVAFLTFGKAFPAAVFAGGDVLPLTFTIANPDPANGVTGITFSDDLDAALTGLMAIGLPASDVCGVGSLLSGTSSIVLTGGVLGPGETCTFDVQVMIPADAVSGLYTNVTSPLDVVVGSQQVSGGAASVATAVLNVSAGTVAVPTLGEWGRWLLIALFAGLALYRLRSN